jgi:hypothetical protein
MCHLVALSEIGQQSMSGFIDPLANVPLMAVSAVDTISL